MGALGFGLCVLVFLPLCSPLQLVQIVSLLFAYTALWSESLQTQPISVQALPSARMLSSLS